MFNRRVDGNTAEYAKVENRLKESKHLFKIYHRKFDGMSPKQWCKQANMDYSQPFYWSNAYCMYLTEVERWAGIE